MRVSTSIRSTSVEPFSSFITTRCIQPCSGPSHVCFFFSSRRRHTRFDCDWSSDVCSSDLGDADALAYYGAHLVAIRWLQGRGAEVLDLVEEVAASPTLAPGQFVYPATVAFLASRAGQTDRARRVLDRVVAPGLAALAPSSTWLTGMCAIADAAATLGDAAVAGQAYEQLRRFAARPIMPSLAIVCFGPVERPLGMAALALGDVEAGVGHLRRALDAGVRLGNRPVAAS